MLYRAYLITSDEHVERAPKIIEADTDAEAAELAKQYVDGCDVEVWDHERLVARITSKLRSRLDAHPAKVRFVQPIIERGIARRRFEDVEW